MGRNDLRLPVHDPTTSGCRDGLTIDRVNENQGAESTLAYLLSLVELTLLETSLSAHRDPAPGDWQVHRGSICWAPRSLAQTPDAPSRSLEQVARDVR
jgi:hypothetical protein